MPAEATGNKYAVLCKNKFIGIVSKFELGWVFVEEFNHFTKLNLKTYSMRKRAVDTYYEKLIELY